MRNLIVLFPILAVLLVALPSAARALAANTLVEWNFDSPGDTAGWTVANNVEGLTVKDGCLVGRTVGHDPNIASPLFDIKASPYQYVEIRMRCSKPGIGELFYTNTTEEPYQGFRSDMFIPVEYTGGEFRTYRIFPFWQYAGKIIRVRLDPPENCEFAVDSIKIKELDAPADKSVFFDFTKPGHHWISAYDLKPLDSAKGIATGDPGNNLFISPRIELDPEAYPWLCVMIKSDGVDRALLDWVTDKLSYIREYSVALKPDNKWHVYNFPMEEIHDWSGTIRLFGIRAFPSEGQRVEVRYMGASTSPQGPAELDIKDFGFKEAINRAGKSAVIQAQITNTGGKAAEGLTARLSAGAGTAISGSPSRSMPSLKPGESTVLTWKVTAAKPGTADAVLDIEGGATSTARTALHWYPPVNTKPMGYVPEPKPVRGDFEVGMYYFPGWATYRAWKVLDDFPERRPILGYYREGDPEVADWQIKWMVEHGITFMVYDWYWQAGGRQLEHGIHQGFFNARYHDKIKFCLLWANHNAPNTSSAEDMVNVTKYWLDNYFLRPDYYKVDGKPVVVIFSPGRFTEDMGVEGVRQAFEKSHEMARERGLPGIYFVSCAVPDRGLLDTLEKEGYDALSGYNYPGAGDNGMWVAPYDQMVTGYRDIWNAIADNTKLRYIPVTEPGWDSRPWHGPDARVRTGRTPEKFKTMLQYAKEFVEKRTPDAKPKMVLVEAWNELGEGDYTEPHKQFGFGHLDAIRQVFTSAPKEHDDIVPQDVGLGPYDIPKPVPVTTWEFDDPENPGWDATQNLSGGKVENGCLVTASTGDDAAIYCGGVDLDSSKFGAVEIRMKVDKGKSGQFFWARHGGGMSEETSVHFDLVTDGQFHDYRLDLSQVKTWRSQITALRLDPTDIRGTSIAIDYIRFLKR